MIAQMSGVQVVGEETDGEEAVQKTQELQPDLRYGWTLADMVFPMFVFAVGMAIVFSFPSQGNE